MQNDEMSPAERASEEALVKMRSCIDQNQCFIFEAGAGAGKTYSLVEALKHIIKNKGASLSRSNQRIACITYTKVARNQILERTEGHSVVLSETIHSFCWSLIKKFQSTIRERLPEIETWSARIEEFGSIDGKEIIYDLGYPKIDEHKVWLHHNDVLSLMTILMEYPKFRNVFKSLYPILLIDEYQDTDKKFADSLIKYFVEEEDGPVIGFFGDHWQMIYGSTSCGKITSDKLQTVKKKANFRSEKLIVECLNRVRPELPQSPKDPYSGGVISVFHTNSWNGERMSGGHWGGDLPPGVANQYFENVKSHLIQEGWDFSPENTKILMLTNNVLADRQGYRNLADVFKYTEQYIKKEDDYISFFADVLEPVANSFSRQKYGEMFQALNSRTVEIINHADKSTWKNNMDKLSTLRSTGTIGDVVDHLMLVKQPRLPDKIENIENSYQQLVSKSENDWTEDEKKFTDKLKRLKLVPYREMIALAEFIENKTPFSTKHGVKGEEYENVLIVFGRGWNKYNFDQFLDWSNSGVPSNKQSTYERNRNLFYVACSRPKKRLSLLFTQELSTGALATISNWFGSNVVKPAP